MIVEAYFNGKTISANRADGRPLPWSHLDGAELTLDIPDDSSVARGLRYQAEEVEMLLQLYSGWRRGSAYARALWGTGR